MPDQFIPHIATRGSYSCFRAGDGVGMYGVTDEPSRALDAIIVFCTGEIWSVDAWQMLAYGRRDPPVLLLKEDDFARSLVNYATFLNNIGANPPYRWIAGIENIEGRHLGIQKIELHNAVCLVDLIEEERIYTMDIDPKQALCHFFSKIYDSCGVKRPGKPNDS